LSKGYDSDGVTISTGISQGEFVSKPPSCVTETCLAISKAFDSFGPLNIQGRVYNNTLYPFEINFRFSASVYLRSLAKVTEPILYLKDLQGEELFKTLTPKPGFALRGLCEQFVTCCP
jgi:hypothetical protein